MAVIPDTLQSPDPHPSYVPPLEAGPKSCRAASRTTVNEAQKIQTQMRENRQAMQFSAFDTV